MNKIIFVCSGDTAYRNFILKMLKEVAPDDNVLECASQGELFEMIRKYDELYIICDKFFLGLRLEEKLLYIKGFLSERAKIMVTAWDASDVFFGVRLKCLGFDGFLNNIGVAKNLLNGLTEFLRSGKYFDSETEKEFLSRTLDSHSKYVGDVVTEEIITVLEARSCGLKKSRGKYSTMHNRINSFKKKLGITTDKELDSLIEQIKSGGIL